MYLTVHGAAGILIGSQVGNPWLAFLIGFVSHFILDAIPHDPLGMKKYFEGRVNTKICGLMAVADFVILLLMILILVGTDLMILKAGIVAAVIGALLPDFIWGGKELFKIKNKYLERYFVFHEKFHCLIYKPVYIPSVWAIIIQASFLIGCLWLYLQWQ